MVADNPGAKFHHPQSWQRPGACGVHGKQNNMQDILGGNPPLNMDGWRNSLDIRNENLRICNHATIMPHISLSGRMHQRLKPLGCKYLLGISHQIEQSRRPHTLKRLVAQTP